MFFRANALFRAKFGQKADAKLTPPKHCRPARNPQKTRVQSDLSDESDLSDGAGGLDALEHECHGPGTVANAHKIWALASRNGLLRSAGAIVSSVAARSGSTQEQFAMFSETEFSEDSGNLRNSRKAVMHDIHSVGRDRAASGVLGS